LPAPVLDIRKNLDGPDDILQLHEIRTLLIQEDDLVSLYNRILDAAINLMSSDMASMQLDSELSQLRFVAWKGFNPHGRLLGMGPSRFREHVRARILQRVSCGGG
jgi:hypothetical protein